MKLKTQEEVWQALLAGKTVHGIGRKYKFLKNRVCVYSETLQRWEPSVVAFYGDGYRLEEETEVLYRYAFYKNGRWSETRYYFKDQKDAEKALPFSEYLPIRLDYTKLEVEK